MTPGTEHKGHRVARGTPTDSSVGLWEHLLTLLLPQFALALMAQNSMRTRLCATAVTRMHTRDTHCQCCNSGNAPNITCYTITHRSCDNGPDGTLALCIVHAALYLCCWRVWGVPAMLGYSLKIVTCTL